MKTIKTIGLSLIVIFLWLFLTIIDSFLWLTDRVKFGFIEGQRLTIQAIIKSYRNIWVKK